MKSLRVGLIGGGAHARARLIPGLRGQPDVEILAVCNRRPESTAAVAKDYNIPRTYTHWQDLVADPNINVVVIATWPNLHCHITLAALQANKHVLTGARMSMNATEAHRMLLAARQHPQLVSQLVPSPFGLKGQHIMCDLIEKGFLGELREVQVCAVNAALADPASPLSWRQDAALSGYNMLNLGILHETLLRWVPPPIRVLAQAHAFCPTRIDPGSGAWRAVGTPDSVQVLAILPGGARVTYHLSGATAFGEVMAIHLRGTEGILVYDLLNERIFGSGKQAGSSGNKLDQLLEIPIPPDKEYGWHVEAEFVDSIRTGSAVRFTDFPTGVNYMEFTEAVARSAQEGEAVNLPLAGFDDANDEKQ